MNPPEGAPAEAARFSKGLMALWRWLIAASEAPSKTRYIAATIGLVLVIGLADYATGFELSLLGFYLVPVCLAVAIVGWRFGTLVSVLSVVIWLGGDFLAGVRYANPIVPGWNAVIALGTFLFVAWLLSGLISMHRDMERRVEQRTAALTEENAERVRLEKILLGISERERRAVGRDLHDGLSQHLTGTALVAQATWAKTSARSPEEAADLLRVIRLIEQAIEQTRGLAKGLLLAEIEHDGLASALHDMCVSMQAQFHVACAARCAGALDLGSGGKATHLYRIAEEATRNAIRHGKAKRVEITVTEEENQLVLEVCDDGMGMQWPDVRGAGLGLRIMEHRATIIGGTFSVGAAPGGGTRVACVSPHGGTQP